MKITLDLPDTTETLFINYIFNAQENGDYTRMSVLPPTELIRDGAIIDCIEEEVVFEKEES